MKNIVCLFVAVCLMTACGERNNGKTGGGAQSSPKDDSIVVQRAKDAYLFALPLVLMDISRRQMTHAAGKMTVAENTFHHMSAFPDASFRDVVRPNGDTYYSTAWLNLAKEPVILSVPNTGGRYYMMPMLDAYTNVFASPGKRTTGTDAGNFLIIGPQWTGAVPEGMKQIKAPTDMVWIIGRTQVNSKEDGIKVVMPIQKQYKLTPLSAWGKPYAPPAPATDSSVPKGSPNDVVKAMPVDEFFNYANRLMAVNLPAAADQPAMEKFAGIGVGPGKQFDLSKLPVDVVAQIKEIPAATFKAINDQVTEQKELVNGWIPLHKTGAYGTDYMQRAFVSVVGLGANLAADAVYPSCAVNADGRPLNGANNYSIHFDKGKMPPANAFWSLTMYDADGYMVANPINRFTIGDRSNLKANADGSVDIYIQHNNPGGQKEANWLPAPAGEFNILLRVYWPKEEMINGSWTPPPVKKI